MSNLEQLARAFELGGRDAYIHFAHWCDDLERRLMSDWIAQSNDDSVGWLAVREAVYQGWQERQAQQKTTIPVEEIVPDPEKDSLLRRAHHFGADERYQRFPVWSDDLEYKLRADWRHLLGGVTWLDVREAVKRGWEERRELVTAQ